MLGSYEEVGTGKGTTQRNRDGLQSEDNSNMPPQLISRLSVCAAVGATIAEVLGRDGAGKPRLPAALALVPVLPPVARGGGGVAVAAVAPAWRQPWRDGKEQR